MRWILLTSLALTIGCEEDGSRLNAIPPQAESPVEAIDTAVAPPESEAPVAVCEANKDIVQPPFETVQFSGTGSYDPDGGEIVGYEWRLTSAPEGNSTALSAHIGQTTYLTPQLAGIYDVELHVINALGLRSSQPCFLTISATPIEDLWIELYWSHDIEDMDLHVLRPGGTPRSGGDCYYANCRDSLDWGTVGEEGDDPWLDYDDILGVGPENINILDPEPGEFTVFVHDYPGHTRHESTEVTVNIYLSGAKVFHETRPMLGENTDEYFATVNPTTGVVNPM